MSFLSSFFFTYKLFLRLGYKYLYPILHFDYSKSENKFDLFTLIAIITLSNIDFATGVKSMF